jgi:hypothetical protein
MSSNRAVLNARKPFGLFQAARPAELVALVDERTAAVQARLRRARWVAAGAGTAAVAGAVGLVVLAPWWIGLAAAVAAAARWSIWLDRHPVD